MRRASLMPLLGRPLSGTNVKYLTIFGIFVILLNCHTILQFTVQDDPNHQQISDAFLPNNINDTSSEKFNTTHSAATEQDWSHESCDAIKQRAAETPDVEWWHPIEMSEGVVLQGWEDDWIAHGIIRNDTAIEPYKMDFVYTYVRSDDDFLAMKQTYDSERPPSKERNWSLKQASRTRSWDELRYSVRGTLQHAASFVSNVIIIAKDFTLYGDAAAGVNDGDDKGATERSVIKHVLQVPAWLNESTAQQDDHSIKVIPETSIMRNADCGPTFNSVSVEASFGNIPLSTKHFVGLSDDMMLGQEVSSSDFVSPLLGMSFSWYAGIWQVDETQEPDLSDGEVGEVHTVRHTSFLLNARFGRRPRTLQIHQAKVINQEILNEAMMTFPRSALLTPLSRYRDDALQLYAWYLHMHYTMEMHREALLWAIVMRFDTNEDGLLDPEERDRFVAEIESGMASDGRRNNMPVKQVVNDRLREAGLPELKIQKLQHTSMDGPQQIKDLTTETCATAFSLKTCFGPDFAGNGPTGASPVSTQSLFERLVYPENGVSCGDCLIKYLLNNADIGLSSLLPAQTSSFRPRAIAAIHKYAYTQTDPDNLFLMVRNALDAAYLPKYATRMPGLMCINDDVVELNNGILSKIAEGFRRFFEIAYPVPSKFENIEPPPPKSPEDVAEEMSLWRGMIEDNDGQPVVATTSPDADTNDDDDFSDEM